MEAVKAAIACGQLLPDFVLSTSDGDSIRMSDFRGRRNLVLVFLQETCDPGFLSALAGRYSEVRTEDAEVLTILPGGVAEARRFKVDRQLPFPVLADEDEHAHRLYGGSEAGNGDCLVVVADRYGEIWRTSYEDDLLVSDSDVEGILGWLEFINAQCPE